MVEEPALTPVAMPVEDPIAALLLLLLQVPPPASLSVVVKPIHTFVVPGIAAGSGFTVTAVVAAHPVAGSV